MSDGEGIRSLALSRVVVTGDTERITVSARTLEALADAERDVLAWRVACLAKPYADAR